MKRKSSKTEVELRFVSRIVFSNKCWLWHKKSSGGYGQFNPGSKTEQAHRFSYKMFTGNEIPKGFHVDHLCKNRLCVNPGHLEAVTPSENNKRADNSDRNKPFCFNGHPFDEKNTYRHGSKRYCRVCKKLRMRKYSKEKKA